MIDRCWAKGESNPIISIHDVGAGGLSNALPELVHDSGRGARFELRDVPNDEPGMSPMELWCNESQERYVLGVAPERLAEFEALCARERCPYAVVGETTDDGQLVVADAHFGDSPIDLPLSVLLGKPPKMQRDVKRRPFEPRPVDIGALTLDEAVDRVLTLPSVGDKGFLISIGDRTVSGLVCRDQMVGPHQVPVADAAVTLAGLESHCGEAMAIGERTPIALLDPAAAARMTVGEAVTNIACAPILGTSQIKLSANWMAAANHPGEGAGLYDAVRAVGHDICPALGIAVPVGKDSMSMRTVWDDPASGEHSVTSPISLIVTAFAPVYDTRRALTPQLRLDKGETQLLLVDLGAGRNRMGGSALAQVLGGVGDQPPDVDDAAELRAFFDAIQTLNRAGHLLAYHDRSDGGLFATLCEMAFAGGTGIAVELDGLPGAPMEVLFSEELGAVLQVADASLEAVRAIFGQHGLGARVHAIGRPSDDDHLRLRRDGHELFAAERCALRARWSDTTHRMQALRDDEACADEEQALRCDPAAPGIAPHITFDLAERVSAPFVARGARPRMAILREQGVNGQIEMAAAFHRAGFESVDVHMSDILGGGVRLADFKGLAACGGFSYGDVLGAGEGWAKSILFNTRARDAFSAFFEAPDTFALGVCNGCQMLSTLRELIPGSAHWPRFVRNRSDRFEARLVQVEMLPSPSVLLQGMVGTRAPVALAHGEGRAQFEDADDLPALQAAGLVSMRFVDGHGAVATRYPENPNGSPQGVTGLTTTDGRVTIMMPHPERVFRAAQFSWCPESWGDDSPWQRLFDNARVFVG